MIAALILVAVLLLFGVGLRLRIAVFQRLYIPASVIAGAVGLVVVQSSGGDFAAVTNAWAQTMRSWPGWLIAVVFAGMLLSLRLPH